MSNLYQTMIDNQIKWDRRMIGLAEHVAQWSKDPHTKVGAVITDGKHKILSIGYNGFPVDVKDDEARYDIKDMKYAMVVHAELNSILNAGKSLQGSVLYCTLSPCRECAKAIIQSGIYKVIFKEYRHDAITELLFSEADLEMEKVR